MFKLFGGHQQADKKRGKSRKASHRTPMLEILEPRQLLSVSAQAPTATMDTVGNTLATALAVSNLDSSGTVYQNTISQTNTRDLYKITLTSAQILDLSLTGLTGNLNMRLLNENGRTLYLSGRNGTAGENIETVLQAGTYYAYVYHATGYGAYSLNIRSTNPVADNAGNSRAAAKDLGELTSSTSNDYIGATDTNDYYKFNVNGVSSFSLSLTGLSADADVQLLNSRGQLIARSINDGTSDESIATTLASGVYFIRVYRYSGNTNYTLTASSTKIADNAGNTRTAARDIGELSTTAAAYSDWIGNYDTTDFYKFTLSSQSTVSLALTGLSANVNMQLQDANGNSLAISGNSGSTNESISGTLDAGTYYVRLYRVSGNTNYTLTASATAIAPTPTPDPTPTPTPTPTPDPSNTDPGTVAVKNLVSLYELDITGSTGNDTINVTENNGTLTVTINGNVTTYSASNIGEIALWGGAGNDTITVDSSVTLAARLYGGAGADTLTYKGTGRGTLVAIGGGSDLLVGNGTNTSFWFDASDTASYTSADSTAGRVHKVSSFYQPYTTNTTSSSYVSLELNGQNLTDPSDSGTTIRLTNRSFWGVSPTADDINQGYLGDCYYLATLAAMAQSTPNTLMELAVDLGDGTYAVQYKVNGVATYVRVDGDLASSNGSLEYAYPGSSGSIWGSIMEKAYAYFRTGANTYSSLEGGLMSEVFSDFGITSKTVNPAGTSASTLYSYISNALAAGKAVTIGTNYSVSSSIPLIGSHAYTVMSVSKDSAGNITYLVRNPWGFDGVSNNSDLSDGLVTVTAAQLASACDLATWMV